MKKTLFIYSGEGTHSAGSQYKLLKHATLWPQVEAVLTSRLNLDIETLWKREIGSHQCPYSPLLTVITQICLSDIWRQWGYRPDIIVGHSTGELAAAYQAGLYSLEEILGLALDIGKIASRIKGTMAHGPLSPSQIADLSVNLSSFNFDLEDKKHVTLSGYTDEIDAFIQTHPDFVKMKLPHPWHHPDYGRFSDQLSDIKSNETEEGLFVSGVTTRFETCLEQDHWLKWLVNPIDFTQTMETIKKRYDTNDMDVIEIGFHPILEKCCQIFPKYTHVSSMFRGEDDIKWILYQRKKLARDNFIKAMTNAIDGFRKGVDFHAPLAYQGFDSLAFTQLSLVLQPFFPSLAPQDFYRHRTIDQLIERFGLEKTVQQSLAGSNDRNEVVISGMSCRLPAAVETLPQFWDILTSRKDQVQSAAGRGGSEAGFLNDSASRFDHRYFNISQVEARTMDPQQILALELTEMLFKDAGIDPETLDKKRVGVYMGVWSQEYHGDSASVYYPTGTNPSIIASRISYQYDLRGPSWVSNTACSSSLVAIHYAAKDIEAGRVDYAIAGGVNMLLDEPFSTSMRNSGFLSRDNRCKAFDNDANGYVRAEGGGLVLLVKKSLADTYYAELAGSAINQNGGRSQVITAPHQDAQEEVITTACADAGITPQEISYVECHGTGTKIGDPIEISAIINTIARDRKDICHLGSVKSNIGHLESAAGIAGLIKSVVALNYGSIPPNLHFNAPNAYIDFQSHGLNVVTKETIIDPRANIGISSFGFGGSNAHIVIKGAESAVRKKILPLDIPFDREQSTPIDTYLRLEESTIQENAVEPDTDQTGPDVRRIIQNLFFNLTGVKDIEADIELIEQGLDSMSATELVNHLEEVLKIEIEPDLLFEYPLFDQLVEELENRMGDRDNKDTLSIVTRQDVDRLVSDLFFQLTGINEIQPDIEMTEQGLDSMSGTELISQLETSLAIEINPELLFEYPLRDQFVDEVWTLAGGNLN